MSRIDDAVRGAAHLCLLFAFCFVSSLAAQTFQWHGYLSAREIYVNAQRSWIEGGVGRFDVGAGSPDDHRTANTGVAQLGVDWTPSSFAVVHADGLARHQQPGALGKRAGLVQAYADVFNDHFRVRAGLFWLSTSRENVDPLWASRYTLTDSALNTWIGQEVRPIGVELQYSPNFYLTAAGTVFRGVDTMGTLLSDRGWTFGSRLSALNEQLPVTDGETRPIGKDLDSRNGYAGRVRFTLPERALVQVTRLDNRATLSEDLVDGQEPWRTRFTIVGGTLGTNTPSTVAAEWIYGSTTVGFPGGTFTMNVDTAYVLLTNKRGPTRWTVRAERFSTHSQGSPAADGAREKGHALTIAMLRDLSQHLRAGIELVRANGDRPGLAKDGFDPRTGGKTITLELRYAF